MDIALAPGAQVFAAGVCYSIVGSIVRHAFEAITHFDVSSSERLTFSHCCDSVNSRILRILVAPLPRFCFDGRRKRHGCGATRH